MQKSKSREWREVQNMSESDDSEDGINFFSAAGEDNEEVNDDEGEVAFPIGGGNAEEEEEEEDEETAEDVNLGSPIYVVFNRRVTSKSWFSVPRVARTSTIAGVVRCYDRPVVVESAERMGALILDHKSWPTREALLDLVAADQVVVLQGNFKEDPTLRYVWGVILTTGSSKNTEDHRIFRTLPKRVYGELLSAYSKDAELVGSSLLDMESTDNNSRSFNPTICSWQRVTLDGFPRTAAVTPSKDVTADKLPKPIVNKVDSKVGTIFDSRPSEGSASTNKSNATTLVAINRKPAIVRKPAKKTGVVANEASKKTVVAPTAATFSAATKTVAAQRAPATPTIIAPALPPTLPIPSSSLSYNLSSKPPVVAATGLGLDSSADSGLLMSTSANAAESTGVSGPACALNPKPKPALTTVSKKRKLTEIFDVPSDEITFEFKWPVNAKGAKVTIEYY